MACKILNISPSQNIVRFFTKILEKLKKKENYHCVLSVLLTRGVLDECPTSCRKRLGSRGGGGGEGAGGAMTEGYLWTGSVPADRAWLTADNPADAMQRYCPQVCACVSCRVVLASVVIAQ